MSDIPEPAPFEDARRVARNTIILLASKFISKPLYLIYIFLIARALGVEDFGRYSFAITFAGFFVILADFGLKTPVQRAIARDRDLTSLYLINALWIKVVLTLVAIAVFYGTVVISGYGSLYGAILYVALAIVVIDSGSQMLYQVFRAHEVMHYEAVVNVLRLAFMLILTLLVIEMGYGLMTILLVMLLSITLALSFNSVIYSKKCSTGGGRCDWKVARNFLKMAVVFGLGSGLYTLYSKIDIVMLERMAGQRSVGLYAAAYTLLENLEIICVVYIAAFMPHLFRTLTVSKERALHQSGRSIGYLLLIGLPTATGLSMLSGDVIELLYGADFAPSAAALAVLIWAVPVKYTFMVLSALLIALDKEKTGLYTGTLGVCVNILLNMLLIPLYAHLGAAIATLITETLILVFQCYFVHRYAGVIPLPVGSIKLVASNVILAICIWPIRDWGLLPVAPIAILAYAFLLYITGFFTTGEEDFLREMIGSLRNRLGNSVDKNNG